MACGPLHGIKVIDSSHMLSGPYCCQMLGDLGASVIKVESTGRGDRSREGPPFSKVGHVSYTFLSRNRNKRSICIDLANEEGRGIMYRLVGQADVLVHNLRRETMSGFGLSYEDLKVVNPRLIYASISGFGDRGPYKDLPGQDMQVQAMSGILSITGYPGLSSTPIGTMVGDAAAGVLTAYGVVAALYAREKMGKGQEVTNSLLSSLMALQASTIGHYLGTGQVPTRQGTGSPSSPPPYGTWKARDGKELAISTYRYHHWPRFCEAIGLPHLAEDPRFDSLEKRLQNREELADIVQGAMLGRDRDEWIPLLREYDQWVVPVRDYGDIFSDSDVWENDLVAEMEHPTAGPIKTFGIPVKLSDMPGTVRRHPPTQGEHTQEVLQELGYSNREIERLYQQQIVK